MLLEIYNSTKGAETQSILFRDLGRHLNKSEELIDDAYWFLIGEEFITSAGNNMNCRITHEGVYTDDCKY